MTPKRPIRGHIEASTIIFTQFVLDGVSWNLTMREGATAEQTLALLAECQQVQAALAEAGAIFVLNRDARETLPRPVTRRPSGGNGAGRAHAPTDAQADASAQPSSGTPGSNGHKATVKTAAWATATASLAARYPCFRRDDGRPDWHVMTEMAAQAGFPEITDANLVQVAAALEAVAHEAGVTV